MQPTSHVTLSKIILLISGCTPALLASSLCFPVKRVMTRTRCHVCTGSSSSPNFERDCAVSVGAASLCHCVFKHTMLNCRYLQLHLQAAMEGVMEAVEAMGAFGSSTERHLQRGTVSTALPDGAVLHDVHVKYDR